MNTTISFEIAKLLKEKGFSEKVDRYFISPNEKVYNYKLSKIKEFKIECEKGLYQPYNFNDGRYYTTISAPTIAEVVMWLYKKHKIWIYVTIFQTETQFYCQSWIEIPYKETICVKTGKISHTPSAFDSITEAYEAAINYTLNNLI